MTKEKFLSYPKFTYVAIIPIVAILFLSFSRSQHRDGSISAAKVFVIDAAHGGSDAGAISSTGLTEKDLALNLANLVQDIGKENGLNILLTRTGDQTLSFKERITFSSEAKADVFLSLHLGFDEKRVHKGVGLFVSQESIKYAESKNLAGILIRELTGVEELSSPKIGNLDAFILKQNPAASAIVEVGCLSDEQDAKFISDPINQRKIAEKIVSALVKF